MKSQTTKTFRKLLGGLPQEIQEQTAKSMRMWEDNPHHPGLHFKKLSGVEEVYSIRIGISWRVVGFKIGDTLFWNWVGHHSDYDRYVKNL